MVESVNPPEPPPDPASAHDSVAAPLVDNTCPLDPSDDGHWYDLFAVVVPAALSSK